MFHNPYGPPRPVAEIASPFLLLNVFSGAKCCASLHETVSLRVSTRKVRNFTLLSFSSTHCSSARCVSAVICFNSHNGGWSPSWVHSARRPLNGPDGYGDREFGGMKFGKGNRSTRRKPAPVPICPPQIPLDQIRARTRAAAVGSQRLTA
jgi:hypothetical protein